MLAILLRGLKVSSSVYRESEKRMTKTIEFRLKTNRLIEKQLLKLLEKGRYIYNLALSECKKRLNRIRADKRYHELLEIRRTLKKQNQPTTEIDEQLRDIIQGKYNLTKTSIEKFVKDNAGYLKEGFNSQFVQILADRAVDAIKKVLYHKARGVRFKGKWDNILASVNSKSADTGFIFDPDSISITSRELSIPLVLEYRNNSGYPRWYLEQRIDNYRNHNKKDISYIRLVRGIIKGHNVFYVQFVINVRPVDYTEEMVELENARIAQYNAELIQKAIEKGKPTNRLRPKPFLSSIIEYPETNKIIELIKSAGLYKEFRTSLDMGPKNMAIVLQNEQYLLSIFQPVFDRLIEYERQLRVLQRRLDRQRRAANPDNYNPDGTIKRKKHLKWKRSKGYIETQGKIREIHRLIRETRKTAINELSTILVVLGNSFRVEQNSYKAWQSNYGKSIGSYAPSYFINSVLSRAERAGSEVVELPLRSALSQRCICGSRQKKKLSERLHECSCGCRAQRDVLSAYLGLFCNPNSGEWESELTRYDHQADRQLLAASHRVYSQTASRRGLSFALCLDKGHLSRSRRNGDGQVSEADESVRVYQNLNTLIGELALAKSGQLSPGIPCL